MHIKLLIAAATSAAILAFPAQAATTAQAQLKDKAGEIVGSVALRQTASQGVWLNVVLDGLPPGPHGFHVHETGSCTPDFKAAGGHFSPNGHKHGALSEGGSHAGDLPNIHVPQSGRLTLEFFAPDLSLEKGTVASVLDEDGSAFIVHVGVDDYTSQPSGDAGDRLACGVIKTVTK